MTLVYVIPVIITQYTTSYTEMSYLVNSLGIIFCLKECHARCVYQNYSRSMINIQLQTVVDTVLYHLAECFVSFPIFPPAVIYRQ